MSDYTPLYVFSRIPNDDDGRAFIDEMKQYFNRDRYKMTCTRWLNEEQDA